MKVKSVRYEVYYREISRCMTQERAEHIRSLRTKYDYTLVNVSIESHAKWGKDATWPKAGDVVAGEALCSSAALFLGEVPYKEPWA